MTDNLPLHRKYRPKTFDEVSGNLSLIESLKTVLDREDRPSTYLFYGPSGNGKTTIARIIANQVGARDRDIKELNISNTRGIDAARDIIENARFIPLGGKAKVYILDECHASTKDFQHSMLKILEEPPKNTYFILCTTEPEKLLPTIRNRCTQYEVSSLRSKEIIILLNKIIKEEGKRVSREVIIEIARISEGCPRKALVILDSVIDIEDREKQVEAINDFSVDEKQIIELCRALIKKSKWIEVVNILKGIDEEPEKIRYAVLGYMTNILLSGKVNDRAFVIMEEFKETFIYTKKAGLVSACYTICNM